MFEMQAIRTPENAPGVVRGALADTASIPTRITQPALLAEYFGEVTRWAQANLQALQNQQTQSA